jgi:WD40 repeat protein
MPTFVIIIGTNEGTVHFMSVKTGKPLFAFSAHDEKVTSLHLKSTEELITGGSDVRYYDMILEHHIFFCLFTCNSHTLLYNLCRVLCAAGIYQVGLSY